MESSEPRPHHQGGALLAPFQWWGTPGTERLGGLPWMPPFPLPKPDRNSGWWTLESSDAFSPGPVCLWHAAVPSPSSTGTCTKHFRPSMPAWDRCAHGAPELGRWSTLRDHTVCGVSFSLGPGSGAWGEAAASGGLTACPVSSHKWTERFVSNSRRYLPQKFLYFQSQGEQKIRPSRLWAVQASGAMPKATSLTTTREDSATGSWPPAGGGDWGDRLSYPLYSSLPGTRGLCSVVGAAKAALASCPCEPMGWGGRTERGVRVTLLGALLFIKIKEAHSLPISLPPPPGPSSFSSDLSSSSWVHPSPFIPSFSMILFLLQCLLGPSSRYMCLHAHFHMHTPRTYHTSIHHTHMHDNTTHTLSHTLCIHTVHTYIIHTH